jgi:2-dehydro-3-deoxy-D-arabinonate dehydratase
MLLAKFSRREGGPPVAGLLDLDLGTVQPLRPDVTLTSILHGQAPRADATAAIDPNLPPVPLDQVRLLAPIDRQEVWGAGVTYERSKVARQEESEAGATFYDQVYRADRPELFLKASPHRVVGPGQAIRARADSAWTVPEPELALVLSPDLRLAGLTIGNDVSARDIEGRNPLYLPQAKVYDACCALGPAILLAPGLPDEGSLGIGLTIRREGEVVFAGQTTTARIVRRWSELIGWLGRDNSFPDGVVLLTGTGIVPPDEFTLKTGDLVAITIDGIGTLDNPVTQGPSGG